MRYNRQELVVGKVSGKIAIVGIGDDTRRS